VRFRLSVSTARSIKNSRSPCACMCLFCFVCFSNACHGRSQPISADLLPQAHASPCFRLSSLRWLAHTHQWPGHVKELVDDVLVPLGRRVLLHMVQVAVRMDMHGTGGGDPTTTNVRLSIHVQPSGHRPTRQTHATSSIPPSSPPYPPDPLLAHARVEKHSQHRADVVVHHGPAP
jgi:hypothetical protein